MPSTPDGSHGHPWFGKPPISLWSIWSSSFLSPSCLFPVLAVFCHSWALPNCTHHPLFICQLAVQLDPRWVTEAKCKDGIVSRNCAHFLKAFFLARAKNDQPPLSHSMIWPLSLGVCLLSLLCSLRQFWKRRWTKTSAASFLSCFCLIFKDETVVRCSN